ncbi:MAG: ABC transporter ATP-binding protein [Pseudomonadota bacterium]
MAVITVANARRLFDGKPVVDDVSLTLRPGQVTALLGGSGAGKSTLLRMIAGLEPIDAGEIRFDDTVWSKPKRTLAPEKRKVGLIFQDFALFPHLTAAENIRFGLAHLPAAESNAIAKDWLERLGLGHRSDAYPHALSGGEQQRVAIARAMAAQPQALLMDEPFSGLDPALRETVRDTALSIAREAGLPTLLVTHDPRDAMITADTLTIMRGGKLIQTGTPEAVYASPADLQTAATLGPVSVFSAIIDETHQVKTPFGTLAAQDKAPGASCTVALREEAIIPGGAVETIVEAVSRVGPAVRVTLSANNHRAHALWSPSDAPEPGTKVSIGLEPSGVFIFDAGPDR